MNPQADEKSLPDSPQPNQTTTSSRLSQTGTSWWLDLAGQPRQRATTLAANARLFSHLQKAICCSSSCWLKALLSFAPLHRSTFTSPLLHFGFQPLAAPSLGMDGSLQELLKRAWTEGRTGHLNAWSEAKAWALREVWRDTHKSDHGLGTHVAGKLRKVGGGAPSGEAVMKLFRKIDADPEWFPGKSLQEEFGPSPVLSGTKRHAIANCAMSMKSRNVEPMYARVVAACPKAALAG